MTSLKKVQEGVDLLSDEGKNPERSKISDGYHTFGELYDHRVTLYITLCKALWAIDTMGNNFNSFYNNFTGEKGKKPKKENFEVWRSRTHSNGSYYEGWFLLGIYKEHGNQITYHVPLELWDDTDFAETLERAPEFDGHTPADVIERLKTI